MRNETQPTQLVDPKFFGWPQDLVEVEFKLTKIAKSADRADIVLFVPSADMEQGRNNRPLAVFECKSPSITLTDTTHEQAKRYADQLDAIWYGITNGRCTYFYQRTKDCWQEMETFPCFTNVIEGFGHIAKRMLEPAGRSRRPSKEELNQVIGAECPQHLCQHVRSLYELLLSENGIEIPVSGYGVEISEDLGSSFCTISDPTGYWYDVWLRSLYGIYRRTMTNYSISHYTPRQRRK